MANVTYIEDIFLELASLVMWDNISYQPQDQSAILSFETVLASGNAITKKQANYILKLVTKYQNQLVKFKLSAPAAVQNPVWRSNFREIDYSRSLSLYTDANKAINVVFKFPYAFKETFQKEFLERRGRIYTTWNKELSAQTLKFHQVNMIEATEFCQKHNFEISQEILDLVDEIGEIWADEEMYLPVGFIENNSVVLKNTSDSVQEYFKNKSNGELSHDMLLAKSMGFPVKNSDKKTAIGKICGSMDTRFWVKDISACVELLMETNSWPVVIILDRTSDYSSWVYEFFYAYTNKNPGKSDLKICFREANDDDKGRKFNTWIKENNLGGTMADGKIFVCNHKLPKWLIKDKISTKMLISNALYPHTNMSSSAYIDSHHTVLYVGNIKPSNKKDKPIVSL